MLLLHLCTAVALSQTFGRFGYVPVSGVPGWKISQHGFQANVPVSDEFVFPSAAAQWKPTSTSAQVQEVDLGENGDGAPSRLKMDLFSPGFSLYFPKGIDLQVGSIGAPLLSWADGSVEQTVSTPPSSWILATFRQNQPPVMFAFPDAPQAMIVDGDPGRWHLRTIGTFSGWVRVLLPFGLSSESAVTASTLGELVKKIRSNEPAWSGAAPQLLDTKVQADATSVSVTWTFDKPGALVPGAALVAGFGGYPVHINTAISQLETSTEEGPMAITKEPKLSLRFPIRPWPACRYVALPGEAIEMPAGKLDVNGAVNLGIRSLSASFNGQQSQGAGASLMAFLSGTQSDTEPNSGIRVPYAADGTGYDVTAAHAFLTQCLSNAGGTASLQNPLLSEIQSRIDFYSWRPWGMTDETWRRSSALAALALEMRPEPEQRLAGAMLQAGLSAQRGLDLWHYWRGDLTKLPQRLEVMENLRRSVFVLQGAPVSDPAVDQLLSPLRFCSAGSVALNHRDGKWFVCWMAIDPSPGELQFSSTFGLKFTPSQNLAPLKVTEKGNSYDVRYTPRAAGLCELEVAWPVFAPSIPAESAQAYAESSR